MIDLSILLISIYVFLETIGYGIYEFKNENKFGGSIVCILSLFMIIFVNICVFRFK